jgi:hypothetical protein
MTGEEPAIESIAAEFPRWEPWRGIDGLFHARIKGATPPVMVRGEDVQDLIWEIERWEGNHDQS